MAAPSNLKENRSPKSPVVALILCIFLGFLGIHRFYVRKIGTGILMLLTFGGFGVWIIVDIVLILSGDFKDSEGRRLEFEGPPSGSVIQFFKFAGAIAAAILFYVITIILIAFYATSGLVEPIKKQLAALKEGDYVLAYSYTSKDFQNATSLDDFKKFVSDYPSLKNNKDTTFNVREYKDGEGYVKGKLESTEGAVTPVEYRLVKENGKWKILFLNLQPTGAGMKIEKNDQTSLSDNSLTNTYTDTQNRFSINYPANWEYEKKEKGVVIFSGKKGTSYFLNTINIQPILTKKNGGVFATVDDFLANLKKQMPKHQGKIIDESNIELPSNHNIKGKGLIFTYTYKGHKIKQMQFVLMREDGNLMYMWGYTAPESRYPKALSIGKAMFESWVIK